MTSIPNNGNSSNEVSGAVAPTRPSWVITRSSTTRPIVRSRPRYPGWVYGPTSDESDFESEDSDIGEGDILRRQQQERGEAEADADAFPEFYTFGNVAVEDRPDSVG